MLGGIGLVAVGVGGYFGLRAFSQSSDAKNACPNKICASQADIDTNDRARSSAKIADVGMGVGVLAIAAGAYLFFTAPGAASPDAASGAPPSGGAARLRIAPVGGPAGAGVSLQGGF